MNAVIEKPRARTAPAGPKETGTDPDKGANQEIRMYSSYRAYIELTERLTAGLLLFLMAATAFYTFRGASVVLASDGGGVMDRLASMVYALGVAAMTYLFWRHAMNIVPAMTNWRDWLRAFAVLVLGACAIVATSSWLNVMALAGAEVQKIELHRTITRFETAHDAFARRLSTTAALRGSLTQGARDLHGWAEAEAAHGAISGFSGRGSVHAALTASAGQMAGVAGTLDEGLAEAEALAGRARDHLAAMRAMADSQAPLGQRLNDFASEADRLRSALVAMGTMDLAGTVARDMERIGGPAVSMEPSARSQAIARAQSSALGKVESIKASIAGPIADAAGRMSETSMPDVPLYRRTSTVRAVWDQAGQLVPYWAGGVALDLMPVLLILFLSVLRRALHPKTQTDDRDKGVDMTIREVRRARAAMDELLGRQIPKTPSK